MGTFLFWTITGILFSLGNFIIKYLENGGIIVGAMLVVLALLTVTNQVKMGKFVDTTEEERRKNNLGVGNKILIPAFLLGVIALLLSQVSTFKIPVATKADGTAIFFGFSTPEVLGLSSLVAILIAFYLTKPKNKEIYEDTTKLLMTVGASSLLPQLLGALGLVFTKAGVGDVIGHAAKSVIGANSSRLVAVIVYCLFMVIFTMIMGNAFAAFTVITIGIGIPFLINNGANPAVVGSLGMTCGYCGTLITPMAANFNIVPASILETKNKYEIIKAQLPLALAMIVVHIVLMYVLAFR